jgi:hypothetical protein
MTSYRTMGLLLAAGVSLAAACGGDDPPAPATATDAGAAGQSTAGGSAAGSGGSSSRPEGCPLTPPTTCPDPKPGYADVKPIFEQRCYSCHDGNHQQWPLTTYQHVADWFGEVRAQMIACSMPPASAMSEMTVGERRQILEWIRCGYPE